MSEQEQCLAELVKLFGVDIPKPAYEGVVAQLASLFAQAELVTSFPFNEITSGSPSGTEYSA